MAGQQVAVRTVRIVCALLLIAASTIPLIQVVGWGTVYYAAANNQFYSAVNTQGAAEHHYVDRATLRLIRPALPSLVVFVLLQCAAVYLLAAPLSRWWWFRPHPFLSAVCLSTAATGAIALFLWMRLAHQE